MSVEARDLMVEDWTRWQGQVINGLFPLGRYLGCSAHSGVFLTKLRTHPTDVAIKLIPAPKAFEETQLPRWNRAGGLTQAHLLPLFEWGSCQLEGLPYLYMVMEYADQTLEQLLLHRALTPEETRGMLLPILDALAFLHTQGLMHGRLKPANILVVGDQLKLASDTIHGANEGTLGSDASTAFDPPESHESGASAAGDIWALGVTLYEALTRRKLAKFGEEVGSVGLPPDFPPAFRELVTSCLSAKARDRPTATELLSSAAGPSAPRTPTASIPPATSARPEPRTSIDSPTRTVPAATAPRSAPPAALPARLKPRTWLAVMLLFVVIITLGWTAVRLVSAYRAQQAPAPSTVADPSVPVPKSPNLNPGGGDDSTRPLALHDVIPKVPQGAARTIRGHIKVSVQATIAPDGSVSTVAIDRPVSSRYFRRLAMEAAKQWTFYPADASSRRAMQIQFDFSRDGTTAHAVPVR